MLKIDRLESQIILIFGSNKTKFRMKATLLNFHLFMSANALLTIHFEKLLLVTKILFLLSVNKIVLLQPVAKILMSLQVTKILLL
jgi:hypothetical protein